MTNPQAELRQQLMNALYHDDFSTIDNLLKQGVNVNLPYNHNGWTPFMWVCKEHCAPEIIGKFLICGGKVDKTNNHDKTPLHIMAAHRSSYDCLQILLAHGANPNAQDEEGNTALHIAAAHPQADIRRAAMPNTNEIALQNDNFRKHLSQGTLVLTQGIRSNTPKDLKEIIIKVRIFHPKQEAEKLMLQKCFFVL